MTKQEVMKLLEGRTGRDRWLCKEKTSGEFFVVCCDLDPWNYKEAMWLGTSEHIENAAEWAASLL